MHLLTRIYQRTTNTLLRQKYLFAKHEPKVSKNTNYEESRKPVVKKVEVVKEPEEAPFKRIIFNDQQIFRHLIMANLTLAGALPFFESVNAGIMLINGGFLVSRVGHEIKTFLLLISNRHSEQLKLYQKPQDYVQLVSGNMLFMSLASILTAFHYYPVAHGLTIVWYLFSVFKGFLPDYYKYMVFPLVFAVLMTMLGSSIKEIVYPSNVDIMQAILPTEEEEIKPIEEVKPTEEVKSIEEEAVKPTEEIISTIAKEEAEGSPSS